MRRLLAVTRRIVVEFARDKRMVATLVVAPCVTFLLFYLVLGSPAYVPRLALVDVPHQGDDIAVGSLIHGMGRH